MRRIEALKYRTEDKQDIIIIVDFVDNYGEFVWRIADIKYKTSRQREYRYYSTSFRDDYSYRKLDINERKEYIMKKYEEFVGRDKMNEAVMAAWEMIKPNLNTLSVGSI